MEKTSAFTMIYTQGPSLPSAPAILNVTKTSDTNSNKGIEDQQNSYTIISETNSGIQDELCNHCETRTDQNDTMLCPESFLHEVYSPNHLKGPKYDKETCKKEGVRILKTEKIEDQPSPVKKRRPVKLDHSVKREMEMQMIAEERRAKAVYMYSMLKSTRSTTIRGTQPMSISKFEDFDFLAKYCIFSQEKLAEYKRAFEAADEDNDGFLDCLQVLMALKEIVPPNALSDAEELYVCRILEIVDYYVTDGLTDLRLFAVMASLAQKIAALDTFMRSLIDHLDFKALELKLYKAKQLFLCNIDTESKSISVEQLLVELKAGGISKEHEEAVQLELNQIKNLDLLDFLTYLPLFVLIHNSVITNPLDDSRNI